MKNQNNSSEFLSQEQNIEQVDPVSDFSDAAIKGIFILALIKLPSWALKITKIFLKNSFKSIKFIYIQAISFSKQAFVWLAELFKKSYVWLCDFLVNARKVLSNLFAKVIEFSKIALKVIKLLLCIFLPSIILYPFGLTWWSIPWIMIAVAGSIWGHFNRSEKGWKFPPIMKRVKSLFFWNKEKLIQAVEE
jgi:hypothetical protein